MFGFGGNKVTAAFDGAGINIRHGRGLTGEIYIGHLSVAVAHADRSAGAGADFIACGASVGDGLHVVELNLPVFQRLDNDVEVSHCEGSASDLKNVSAQIS